MSSVVDITFRLNGVERTSKISVDRMLIDFLRDDLHLTGTKEGCGVGVCGLCAVTVDGALVSACLMLAVAVDGADVRTVEGLAAANGEPNRLQRAFIEQGGFQCGICTPGQLMAASALLAENPAPSVEDIRHWMLGNLCRCTGYMGIVRAINAATSDAG